nr:MAG TPA: hypothetical protein [Caudoviricetes sp.]
MFYSRAFSHLTPINKPLADISSWEGSCWCG